MVDAFTFQIDWTIVVSVIGLLISSVAVVGMGDGTASKPGLSCSPLLIASESPETLEPALPVKYLVFGASAVLHAHQPHTGRMG